MKQATTRLVSKNSRYRRGTFAPRFETLETRVQPGETVAGGMLGFALLQAGVFQEGPFAAMPAQHESARAARVFPLGVGDKDTTLRIPTTTGSAARIPDATLPNHTASSASAGVSAGNTLLADPTVGSLDGGGGFGALDDPLQDTGGATAPQRADVRSAAQTPVWAAVSLGSALEGSAPATIPVEGMSARSASQENGETTVGVNSLDHAIGLSAHQAAATSGHQTSTATPFASGVKPLGQPGKSFDGPPPGGRTPPAGPIRSGFNSNTLDRNDDGSTGLVPLGFTVNFFCSNQSFTGLYVNNNGNLTFVNPLPVYTPPPLGTLGQDIIAPFFADVDTRNPSSGVVTYGQGTVDGHRAFGANWIDVGYYNQHADHLNSFQAIIIDRTQDLGPGDFDIEFNYGGIDWETGDASGGSGGRGGNSARVGYSTNGGAETIELPGSAVNGALLDGGPNALVSHSLNSGGVLGRYVFAVRDEACVNVEQVNYDGAGNVPIRIDAATRIGSPDNPNGEDIEWVRGLREGPNSPADWDTTQAAPAAFLKNTTLHADATFSVRIAGVTSMVVYATSSSPYGNIPDTTVNITNGRGTGSFSSANSVTHVDFNDVSFQWHLRSVTIGGQSMALPEDLQDTTNRIYTLEGAPIAPMAVPWAKVLELSTALAVADNNDQSVVQDLTRGIHNSLWQNFGTSRHFISTHATLVYDPSVRRTDVATNAVGGLDFTSQTYDLTNFLSFMSQDQNIQQCNDNANLLAIFARSLGVNVTPKWVAANPVGPMKPATYYPAGRTMQETHSFSFHQFGFFNSMVYDASTRPNATGDPFMGMSLNDYMNTVFHMNSAQFRQLDVSNLSIGQVAAASFTLNTLTPNHGARGATTSVTLNGAGFGSHLRVIPVDIGPPPMLAAGVTINNLNVVSPNVITFNVAVAATATPRIIRLYVYSPGFELLEFKSFTIDP
jgi:hypothetical protein